MFTLKQFEYQLPPSAIAQSPVEPRDSSQLLVLDRLTGHMHDHHFFDLPDLLSANDVLVRNNTKVLPARVFAQKSTGGHCEIVLLKHIHHTPTSTTWECLTKPGLKIGQKLTLQNSPVTGECINLNGYTRTIQFDINYQSFLNEIDRIGHTPIPPYIEWETQDEAKLREVYQTTYAKLVGSAAAPTAGLHFTPELDEKLHAKGIEIIEVTLHVGLGTFLPLQEEQLQTGKLHLETVEITQMAADQLNAAKRAGKHIIAVGTTTTRTLESCSTPEGEIRAFTGETDFMIQPGYHFRAIDGLITNFHLPQSSLLMLVSAFVCEPNTTQPFVNFLETSVGQAYQHAIAHRYRFFSFGDAMFIR